MTLMTLMSGALQRDQEHQRRFEPCLWTRPGSFCWTALMEATVRLSNTHAQRFQQGRRKWWYGQARAKVHVSGRFGLYTAVVCHQRVTTGSDSSDVLNRQIRRRA